MNTGNDSNHGRTVVVTGAAAGIGRRCALTFAESGDTVVAIDVSAPGLEDLSGYAANHDLDVHPFTADIRHERSTLRVVQSVLETRPRIDVLVNNAGVGIPADLIRTTVDEWDRVLSVNLTGTFLMCKAVVPHMLKQGEGIIVNVASVAGMVGVKERAAYCASKAGVVGLTKALAADYAAGGLRVNAICPGTVATEWVDRMIASDPDPEATRLAMSNRQLDGQMGTPEEVTAGIWFLASSESRFVNGSAFVMDGGLTAV